MVWAGPRSPGGLVGVTGLSVAANPMLLQAIVNAVYGANGIRGLDPGLWRAQLIRTTARAAQLIQALWAKLGGKAGVILDDQGEDGRGVMRLQGVFSDIQMFVGSLTTLQDPLSSILLDPLAFARTQSTVTTLTKKLASLATHYEVADSLPTPLDQWKDEDAQDKAEDLGALPLLIAKSRPTRAVLQKFEADCARRELAELANPDQPVPEPEDASAASRSTAPSPAPSSFASSGLSAARRPEFLRFVYSQNPNLIAANESLDTAVAAGTAALSSMAPPKPSIQSISLGPPKSRKSLVQQRISSFASSADAPPPLPAAPPIALPVRRVASDNPQNTSARKSWTVDMSALNGIQRQSSLSISKPPSLSGPSPQISMAAPPVNWKQSISRPTSIKSRSSISTEPAADKPNGNASAADEAAPGDSDSKPVLKPTFAEQAAAIVAARKQRTISQSSSTSYKDRLLTKNLAEGTASTGLAATPEHPPLPEPNSSSDAPGSAALNLVSETPPSLVSLDPLPLPTDESALATSKSVSVSFPAKVSPSPSLSPVMARMNSSSSAASSSPVRVVARMNSSSSTASPKPPASSLAPSLPSSPPPASVRRPSLAPPPPEPDLDFELVSDLIEHTSMLDVILGPTPDNTEPLTLPSSAAVDPAEADSGPGAAKSAEADPAEPALSASQASGTSSHAPPPEELSLADLMEQASMFESWTPDQDQTSTQLSQIVTSPVRPGVPAESAPPPDPLSAAFLSPPLSPISPVSSKLAGAPEPEERSASTKAASPLSQRPSHLALQTLDKPFGSLPEAAHSEAVLTIAGSPISTPSISGQSWATSLMSTPPALSDFDWNLLNGNYYNTQLSTSLPAPENPLKSGWRILCLDGGGIRGLSMLYVVRELMTSVQTRLRLHKAPLPCEMFEMICGIGTGGIIALLLGRLRLDISVAVEAYLQIVRQVFRQSKGVIAAVRKKTRFSATKLEAVIREVVKQISGQEELYLAAASDARPICRTLLLAMRPSEGREEQRGLMSKLRSYGERQGAGGQGCSIAQAGRATSAAPLFFKPARAEEVEEFGDEPVATSEANLSNPSMEAVAEAERVCPGRRIDVLLSLGAGKGLHTGTGSIARACGEMAQASERTAREVEQRALREGWATRYFRASVNGLKNEDNRGEWENPDWVKAGTVKHLFIDARSQFEQQVDCLTASWKSSYDDEVLRRILLDHGKGTITPRSAFLPSRPHNLAPRADDLRRSISADHAEMQAQAHGVSSPFRKYRASQAAPPPSPDRHPPLPNSLYPASLYEGSPRRTLLPQPTPPPSSGPHLASFELKLPEFNFSKT
ncbi:hypothetical protein PtA15_6A422 [Puccinia triticina]|uniref:PNPLA domain-containing protein n=1 Tax=Puccinia triticina TaxID=208348 RepID=A0ABY7CKN8_9BASI|nr:uncharacterized protein PtA15_6A422 [Puccinia triticina]WAQ85793.1 hypothetical protein PtA15_6A422 [Puccinia triticina]